VEPGEYKAKAHSVTWLTSEYQGTRSTHLEVEFRTQDKRAITWRCSFSTEKAIEFARKQLAEAGWKDPDATKIKRPEDLPNVVTIVIKQGEYKGKPQLRISIKTPFDASPATANDLRSLSAKLTGTTDKPRGAFVDDPFAGRSDADEDFPL
jgi:hypothetical protein